MSHTERTVESERPITDAPNFVVPTRRGRKVSDVIDSMPQDIADICLQHPHQLSAAQCSEHSRTMEQNTSASSSRCTNLPCSESGCSSDSIVGNYSGRDIVEHPLTRQVLRDRERNNDETDSKPTDAVPKQPEQISLNSAASTLVEARMPVGPGSDVYNMNHLRRGMAVIFNNDEFDFEPPRSGSKADVISLTRVLKLLQFEVVVHNNFRRTEIADEISKLASMDHNDCDCFCMVVLTHGEAPELLHAKDGIYKKSELWSPFISCKCPSLAGKPKLFFVQACRGDQLEKGIRLVSYIGGHTSQTDACPRWSYIIPVWADLLMANSTHEGFYSWRDPANGTWYIQMLCDTLTQYHKTTDLLKIMTIINRRVALEYESYVEKRPDKTGCKEMPSFTSTLLRDVYFTPKIDGGNQPIS